MFLEKLQEALVSSELTLIDASRIFMRMNSVYKQASIERHQVKKKPKAADGMSQLPSQVLQYQLLENSLMQGKSLEVLFL